jgi:hypothetical protein
MAKGGWKSTHRVSFDGPSGIKGNASYFSAEEAMRHAADAIRARRIRGPEDHVVLTDKSSGEEMVRWVGNGADTDGFLYVSDSAIKLGYDTDYFASEVYE